MSNTCSSKLLSRQAHTEPSALRGPLKWWIIKTGVVFTWACRPCWQDRSVGRIWRRRGRWWSCRQVRCRANCSRRRLRTRANHSTTAPTSAFLPGSRYCQRRSHTPCASISRTSVVQQFHFSQQRHHAWSGRVHATITRERSRDWCRSGEWVCREIWVGRRCTKLSASVCTHI